MAKNIVHRISFESFLKNDDNWEVSLVVNEKEFPMHRVILAAQSKFFEKLLYKNQFSEGEGNSIKIEAPLEAFELVLKYLCSGSMNLEDKDIEDMLDILELSRRFGIQKLERAVINAIVSITTTENLHIAIKIADLFENDDLKLKCCEVLHQTKYEFCKSENFLQMSASDVTCILSCDKLKITPIERIKAVVTWLKANPEFNSKKFLECIDFSRLSNNQIIKIVAPTGLFAHTYLMELMASRKSDVHPETQMYDEDLTDSMWTKFVVVVGKKSQSWLKTKLVSADKINNEWEMVLDLGKKREINCLKFNLGLPRSWEHFTIYHGDFEVFSYKFMSNTLKWNTIRSSLASHGEQTIYTSKASMRFIRLKGIQKLHDFSAISLIGLPLNLINYYVCPQDNIFNDSNAFITRAELDDAEYYVSRNGFIWNLKNNGRQQMFVSTKKSISFYLNQPYYLQFCRFHLWNYDNKSTYTFDLYSIDEQGNQRKLKHFKPSNEWIMESIPAGAYVGFKLVNCDDLSPIKITYFEASY